MKKVLLSALMACAFTASVSTLADAKSRHKKHEEDGYRYIIAASYYEPSRQVRVPIREARHGTEVYVPKRGWTYCEMTCEHTVQKHYLDFWENQTGRGAPNGFVWDYLTARGIFSD